MRSFLIPLVLLSACVENDAPPAQESPEILRPRSPNTAPPAQCADDNLEPNDTLPVDAIAPQYGLSLHPGDVDLIDVVVLPGEELFVDALFTNLDGNLDLYLTDTAGEALAWSTTDTNDESLSWSNTSNTSLVVTIETNLFDALADDCVVYDLDWYSVAPAVTPPPPAPVCVDDSYENNNTYDDAAELIPATDGVTFFDGIANDTDWFFLHTEPSEEIQITFHHDTPGAAIDFAVWDEAGSIADVQTFAGDRTTVTIPATDAGLFIDLLVSPNTPDTCAPFTLEVVSTVHYPECAADVFEPNDFLPSTATAPALGLSLDELDVDTFSVTLYPGEELVVDAFFSHATGNLDLELVDSAGTIVASSYTTTDDESLSFVNSSTWTETFTIQASLFNGPDFSCQVYDLDWEIFGAVCVDDGFEGNNTAYDAPEVLPELGTSVVLDLVANDDDWFWLQALPGEDLDVLISHSTLGAELELIVYDDVGELDFDLADTINQSAIVPLYATVDGAIYDILIRPVASDVCVPYSLTLISY